MTYDKKTLVDNIKTIMHGAKIMTYDIKNAMKNKISSIIHDRTRLALAIVLTVLVLINLGYFIFRDTHQFGIEDLNRIIENKKVAECMVCHAVGQQKIVAKDTIDMSSSCYKCHREDLDFLVPVSKQVHIYHEGNASILPGYPKEVDYSLRHKEILGDCSTCHVYDMSRPPTCTKCHSGDHVNSKKGVDCLNCHGKLADLFRHGTINLETHNIFGNESCDMCHSSDKISLELANGNRISITQSSKLCKQCHSGTYEKWVNGGHVADTECVVCHNPHSPKYVNQTIIDITKDINAERIANDTRSKPKNNKDSQEGIGLPSARDVDRVPE